MTMPDDTPTAVKNELEDSALPGLRRFCACGSLAAELAEAIATELVLQHVQ